MRVVFMMNNYSMRTARRLVAEGTYPAQHLWGYPGGSVPCFRPWALAERSLYDVDILGSRWFRNVRNGFVKFFGDPLQTVAALRAARRGALIYAADQRSAILVLLLKRLRLVNLRVAVLVHHPPRSAWER